MMAASPAANTVLPADYGPSVRHWMLAAAAVVLVHAAIMFWILHVRESPPSGAPAEAILIELPPMDVASPSDAPPEAIEGPQMTQADPEEAEAPPVEAVPELPKAKKPAAVLMIAPKPKRKPRKIVKEVPKPAVKRTHELPAPRTQAPRHSAAPRGPAAAARQGAAGAAARSACAAGLGSLNRHYPEAARARGEQGTVRLALTIGRNGRVTSARVIGSSGSPALDQAALQMARSASCPAMETSASFMLPVRFNIR